MVNFGSSTLNLNLKLNLKKYAILKIYVNNENEELLDLYKKHIQIHNYSILNDEFPNSGFDLFLPKEKIFDIELHSTIINFEIKTEMNYYDTFQDSVEKSAFYIYPRSSLSKTPLMLSNHTGIIDCGYRGWLQGAFRWLNSIPVKLPNLPNEYILDKHSRIIQICHPSLCPILVEMVDEEQLSTTSRGDGSFGSTGTLGVMQL